MPRKPRLFVSGGIYHVYCRTHRGEMRFERQMGRDRWQRLRTDSGRRSLGRRSYDAFPTPEHRTGATDCDLLTT
jgi:hypothetical protein